VCSNKPHIDFLVDEKYYCNYPNDIIRILTILGAKIRITFGKTKYYSDYFKEKTSAELRTTHFWSNREGREGNAE